MLEFLTTRTQSCTCNLCGAVENYFLIKESLPHSMQVTNAPADSVYDAMDTHCEAIGMERCRLYW